MATRYVVEGGAGTGDGSSPANAMTVASFNATASGGNTYYFLDTITTAVQFNGTGTAAAHLIVRGDYAGRPAVLDGQLSTNTAIALICPDGGTDLEYVEFINLTIKDFQKRAIFVQGPSDGLAYTQHVTIDGITTSNIGASGDSAAGDISFSQFVRKCVVRNCYLRGNGVDRGVDGIVFGGTLMADGCQGSGFRIYNNDISGHEENCIDFKFHKQSAGGEGYSFVYGNRMGAGYGAAYAALDVHYGSQLVKVFGNTFYDARVGVRLIEETADTVANVYVYGNVFEGITTYGVLGDTTNHVTGPVFVYNNTFDGGITAANGCCVRADGKVGGAAWTVKNNVFDGDCQLASNYQLRLDDVAVANGSVSDYNVYNSANAGGDIANWGLAGKTLAELRAAGQEANGSKADPQLDSNYALGNSALKETGTFIAGVTMFDGLPSPLHPDPGAVQDRNLPGRKSAMGHVR